MGRRGRARWPLAAAARAYGLLLLLYPRQFRREYGADMAQVFGDLCRDAYRWGSMPSLQRLWAATLRDLAISVPREHLARVQRPAGGWRHRATPAAAAVSLLARRDSQMRRTTMANRHHMRRWLRRLRWWGRPAQAQHQEESRVAERDRDRFEKFTERARRVLSLAQEEAQRFNHDYIGTEHMLLGLVREGDGVAAKVLGSLGVELDAVRQRVEQIIWRGDRIVLGEIGLTPRARKVVELAIDEARRMDHRYIGTEHLLLGLVREGEGIAAGVLESLGVQLAAARQATLDVLRERGEHGGDTGAAR
jgi:hypothetical protein